MSWIYNIPRFTATSVTATGLASDVVTSASIYGGAGTVGNLVATNFATTNISASTVATAAVYASFVTSGSVLATTGTVNGLWVSTVNGLPYPPETLTRAAQFHVYGTTAAIGMTVSAGILAGMVTSASIFGAAGAFGSVTASSVQSATGTVNGLWVQTVNGLPFPPPTSTSSETFHVWGTSGAVGLTVSAGMLVGGRVTVGTGSATVAFPVDIRTAVSGASEAYPYTQFGMTAADSIASGNENWSLRAIGSILVGGTLSIYSDQRAKVIEKRMDPKESKDLISKLSPVLYKWNRDVRKDASDALQYGLLAQEVEGAGLGDLIQRLPSETFDAGVV